ALSNGFEHSSIGRGRPTKATKQIPRSHGHCGLMLFPPCYVAHLGEVDTILKQGRRNISQAVAFERKTSPQLVVLDKAMSIAVPVAPQNVRAGQNCRMGNCRIEEKIGLNRVVRFRKAHDVAGPARKIPCPSAAYMAAIGFDPSGLRLQPPAV